MIGTAGVPIRHQTPSGPLPADSHRAESASAGLADTVDTHGPNETERSRPSRRMVRDGARSNHQLGARAPWSAPYVAVWAHRRAAMSE